MRSDTPTPSPANASWVVTHDAWRDYYQLPGAFAEAGLLERFVTDWYTPADRPLWRRVMESGVFGSFMGLRTRFSPLVPSAGVQDAKLAFLAGLLERKLRHLPFDDIAEGAKSGRRAAALANRTGSALLAASYSAAAAFEALRPGLARVLYQVHPQPRFLRDLYERQMALDPDYALLRSEAEFAVSAGTLASWEREAALADHILCASSFTRRSLIWSGIPEDRISVVPYGVETERFQPSLTAASGPLRLLFVGQRVARKGLRPLLRAWSRLQPAPGELILAGGHQAEPHLLDGFEGLYTDVPRMSKEALVQLYQTADVFVLPSLAEGFGHVYLEALACGTPVLCTGNTGAADFITEGQDGWIVPAGDTAALEARLAWILAHPEQVRAMRPAARATAERHSWSAFRAGVRSVACRVAASGQGHAAAALAVVPEEVGA